MQQLSKPKGLAKIWREVKRPFGVILCRPYIFTPFYKYFIQPVRLRKKRTVWNIEIGPGTEKIEGFEAVNVIKDCVTDYVCDLSKEKLPFHDHTIDIIYTSHFLEHIEWFQVSHCINEIYRVLKLGGRLEIWVPDGLKILEVLVQAESGKLLQTPDQWTVFNPGDCPYLWVNGRTFYGANPRYPSWHKGMFTYHYLELLLGATGFRNIQKLENHECRGYDHGWVNLGITAIK